MLQGLASFCISDLFILHTLITEVYEAKIRSCPNFILNIGMIGKFAGTASELWNKLPSHARIP